MVITKSWVEKKADSQLYEKEIIHKFYADKCGVHRDLQVVYTSFNVCWHLTLKTTFINEQV